MTFTTIEQSIRANGDRHLERAISYISAGYPDHYADGSLRKARRNYKRMELLTPLDKLAHDIMQPMLKNLANQIAESVMNGQSTFCTFHYLSDEEPVKYNFHTVVDLHKPDNVLSMENMKHGEVK